MGNLLILLVCICLIQFFYLRALRRQLKEWLHDLKEIRKSPKEKLFTRKKGILSDITFELNNILKENQEQILQLKKADLANKQVLTNLSHDVRTPLSSLIGYLEALQNGLADDPEKYTEISYQKALALKDTIDMLFEWCKITSKEQQFQMIPEDINELTRQIIIDWLPVLEKEKISLKVDLSNDEWMIRIDCMAYKRILNNLIQNAIYHGKCSAICVETKNRAGKVSIYVSNNGIPIPKDQLPYIFDRLYKCDSARSGTGSGLGLAIAKELALEMNGIIEARSSDARGTTFILFFPAV